MALENGTLFLLRNLSDPGSLDPSQGPNLGNTFPFQIDNRINRSFHYWLRYLRLTEPLLKGTRLISAILFFLEITTQIINS